ncbi:MAG: hypothetical protein JST84_05570 [Acidobacteria bacterium]|nr:hypothetical protein [Acidobacteriota bacterium]
MFTPDQITLLRRLQGNWPKYLHLMIDEQNRPNLAGHPLADELLALSRSERASLPFFTPNRPDRIIWLTIAPDVEELQSTMADLRAWLLPSFGWEDEPPIVVTGESSGPLSEVLRALSPAGYFRWWTMRAEFNRAVNKLRALRNLQQSRPAHAYARPPSLFDLRQQYDVALLTGDAEAAQEAIDGINLHHLDTAANTCFMQLRLWENFREYERIVTHPQLAELVRLRMPHSIRLVVIRGFHAYFLAPLEERRDIQSAANVYAERVHDWLTGLLELCRPSDGIEARRCIGYKAWLLQDGNQAKQLRKDYQDDVLDQLLAPLALPETLQPSIQDCLYNALRRGDWRAVQEAGQQLLLEEVEGEGSVSREYVQGVLRLSLEFHANPGLRELLGKSLLPSATIPAPVAPQTWPDFVARIKEKEWSSADCFLVLDNRPSLGDLSLPELSKVVEVLEELLTDPDIHCDQTGHQLVLGSLPVIIKDFLLDPEFPRPYLTNVYRQLLQLWCGQKRGSASPPDANLVLTLAEAVMRLDSTSEREVAEVIRDWWTARRARAMLPFLLSGLDILSELTAERIVTESLWVDGAALIRLDPLAFSLGERQLWRVIGSRIGLDENTIDDFLGIESASENEAPDPLTEANFKKVAIVSLREEAAQAAAALIGQRTKAQVVVVSETHAGIQTASAKTADVILFVWASSTHAVYRAFDSVREKLSYVQGKGAASIVLALERWLMKQ